MKEGAPPNCWVYLKARILFFYAAKEHVWKSCEDLKQKFFHPPLHILVTAASLRFGKEKKVKEKSFRKTTLPISWRHFSSASALPLFAFSNDATKLNAIPSFAINFWITYLTTYKKEVTKKNPQKLCWYFMPT